MSKAELHVNIINNCAGYPAPRTLLRDVLGAAWAHRRNGRAAVNLVLVNDREMRRMNRTFKHRNRTTDVLAFDNGEHDPATGVLHLGDIAVSVDTARREARERNLRIRDEVTLYALHGLLHLMGMRDNTAEGRAAMERAQAREFARHGLKSGE